MADANKPVEASSLSDGEGTGATGDLAGGNYEVIRRRLETGGRSLRQKTDALNGKRQEVFGASALAVVANERIRTENNCVPRDIVSVGNFLLFGYNVFIGLKSETQVSDVFAIHRFAPEPGGESYDCSAADMAAATPWLLADQFQKDFHTMYRYYRDTELLQLVKTDTRILAIFRIGASFRDVKVFRWGIAADGSISYIDDRGDNDFVFPPAYDFTWTTAGREQLVGGAHPHINIDDTLFVDTIGGDLTVKVENNTATGQGIYAEPVTDRNQTLDDAQFQYARLGGLILVKVLPFRETEWRYLVYSDRTRKVVRIDAIGQACVQLPEDHGILFPGGYFLQSGEYKVFDSDTADLELKRTIKSPNGEDVLYVFHRRRDGHYALLSYNLIRKEVQTPIHCHGYSLFDDGRLVVFRVLSEEPTRVHPMQVWQTPFTSAEYAASAPKSGSFLAKVGNADLVRGISDGYSIARLVSADAPSRQTYEDIIAQASRAVDSYYWLGHEEVGDLKSELDGIRRTAELIIDEFEKVLAFRKQARDALAETEARVKDLEKDLRSERWQAVQPFLGGLTGLRELRGHIITLREMRYMDLGRLDELEAAAVEHVDRVSRDCVRFLLRDEAFVPLHKELDQALAKAEGVKKVAEIKPLMEAVEQTSAGLDLLSEVVGNLQIDDATQRTTILEGISEIFGHVNRVRATIDSRRRELMTHEGRAEFGAQFKLLGQSVASAVAMCDTPERCDEELARLMVQLEELEARFSEFDEFVADLAAKREEVYDALSGRKQTLLDERQRRAQNIIKAAERILEGVGRRARALKSADAVNGYFASDAMIMKLRQLASELVELCDTVKADEIAARLKTAQKDALRALRDKLELFEAGEDLIKLGRHRFSVNTQPLELTMVQRGDGMAFHLGGTDFYEAVADAAFAETQAYWSQDLVSETEDVYRAEYLAASILFAAETGAAGASIQGLHDLSRTEGNKLVEHVREFAQERYDEGYERGIHDADAALILEKLLAMRETAGLLRFAAAPRALAVLFWAHVTTTGDRSWEERAGRWQLRARNLGRLRKTFADSDAVRALASELGEVLARFAGDGDGAGLGAILGLGAGDAGLAGAYLAEELMADTPRFVLSAGAAKLREVLTGDMELYSMRSAFEDDMRELQASGEVAARFALARAWVDGYVGSRDDRRAHADSALEAAALLATDGLLDREISSALTEIEVKGLLGRHPRLADRAMTVRIDEFESRLRDFVVRRVPGYRAYRTLRSEVLARERRALRIDELVPRVMSSFVRNRLINDVYLPLIGDNLAKQIGAAGEGKRTDLMGMLLLISPPGYGKTTLMEYVASRLGLVFVKVNGPSLGHAVHSIDPDEAPNATARQEVEKINLALEMGNNVMLYLDDIQHTHPEFLQKFISLCDAQRRIEGVWKGRTRTYDMRGKKFCVVMAGNPYTESGESFRIPDMLANRADVYNLGDVLDGKEELFALSYIENSLTSNQALAPLSTREQSDVYKLVRMARGEEVPTTELSHGYSAVELSDIRAVLGHLFHCQDVLLKVNQLYIASAAQDDRFRTEPPFKLQGSYRNMNKLAEKIVSAMTADEVERLIDDHYLGEAQTLTVEAEQNLLKLAELRGRLSPDRARRWEEIKAEFMRVKRMGGGDDDPVTRVTGTLSGLSAELGGIKQALQSASQGRGTADLSSLRSELAAIREALESASQGLLRNSSDPGLMSMLASELTPIRDALVQMAGRAEEGGAGSLALARELRAALEPLHQPVQVHVDAPAGMQELLAQQVAIVERTLVPLVRTATQHLHDSRALGNTLAEVLTLLGQVDERLRASIKT